MPRLPMNLINMKPLSPKHELLSQKSPSPRQPSIQYGDGSPDRDGGHTERTHNKGRTLRFNLQECDDQFSGTNDQQVSDKAVAAPRNRNYMAERSFDRMIDGRPADYTDNVSRNFDAHSQAQPSYDNRSMACRSENLSEHYIKAKKFAALRSNKKSDAASTAKKGKKKLTS